MRTIFLARPPSLPLYIFHTKVVRAAHSGSYVAHPRFYIYTPRSYEYMYEAYVCEDAPERGHEIRV